VNYKNRGYDVWENGKIIYNDVQMDFVVKLMQENGAPLVVTPHSELVDLGTGRWPHNLSNEELIQENSSLLDDLMKAQDDLADTNAQLSEAQAALHYMRHLYEQLESKYAEVKRVYKQMEEALK
jgi:hypothetical protein